MRPHRRLVLLLGLLAGAAGVPFAPLPAPLRAVLVLPVLVGVAGTAATDLVLGRRRPGRDRSAEAGADGVSDALVRLLLPVVLGLLSIFVAVAALWVLGLPLSRSAMPVAAASVAGALLLLATDWRAVWHSLRGHEGVVPPVAPLLAPDDDPDDDGTGTTVRRPATRPVAAVAGAVLLLGSCVLGAIAMQPTRVERFSQLEIDTAGIAQGSPLIARPGDTVNLAWTLRSHGYPLGPAEPGVRVTVGDRQAAATTGPLSASVSTPSELAPAESRTATTSFDAPAAPGLYRVSLEVQPSEAPSPEPLLATVVLQVAS